MKEIVLIWLWVGICFLAISVVAGPEPIVAYLIFTGIAGPIFAWVEYDIRRIKRGDKR